MTILRVAATADDTLDQTSDTQLNSMVHTIPASGDYLAVFTCYVVGAVASGSEITTFSVYVGGTIVDHSEREIKEGASVDAAEYTIAVSCAVSSNGSQDVEVRYRTGNVATPMICKNREFCLFPINGTDVEISATGDTTFTGSNDTYEALLTATTPASGDYLLTFSTSGDGPSGSELAFRISVGGTPLAHTVRKVFQEASLFDSEIVVFIACAVSPNGSQDVVVEWTRTAGAGTLIVHERTLNLIPTDSGDIFEASGTVDDTDSTTDDKQIDDLLISSPGADGYLVLFSATDFYATAGNKITTYRIRNAGTTVTDSDRLVQHESSLNNTNIPVMAGGRVTVAGASDDLQMYWQSSSATARICHERTFIAIREGVAVPAGNFLPASFSQSMVRF